VIGRRLLPSVKSVFAV